MVTFNIIEGDDFFESIHDEFLRLYHSKNISVKEMIKVLGITRSQYQNFRKRLIRTGEIHYNRNPYGGRKKVRLHSKKFPRNYFWSSQHERFHVKYRNRYYACFKEEDEAKRFVELMRKYGWDRSRIKEFREFVLKEKRRNGV